VQEAINRVQPEAQVRDAIRWARERGFQSINIDLVYGLPHQTVDRFRPTMDGVINMAPDRIALFNYAHVPQIKKHQRLIAEDALPAPTEKLAIFKMALERLTAPPSQGGGGYRFIGMDHFARPDDELARAQDAGQLHRNFQGYSTRAGADVYAFGVSGIHQLTTLYAQNVKALDAYYERIDAGHPTVFRGYALTTGDRLRRHIIMELMCHFRLEKAAVERWSDTTLDHPIDFDAYFADALSALEPLADDGLVALRNDAIEVLPKGQLLIRNVAATFDAYLQPSAAQKQPVYSQTV
jgi:oxygen-independent coproporphyrinogen-3 oxidase